MNEDERTSIFLATVNMVLLSNIGIEFSRWIPDIVLFGENYVKSRVYHAEQNNSGMTCQG